MLSESVSKALSLVGGTEAAATATFVDFFDKFFDLLNVSNFGNSRRKRKPFQAPYCNSSDTRLKVQYMFFSMSMHVMWQWLFFLLQWLEEQFLPYLDYWEASVNAREGFTPAQKKRMLLSCETLLGIRRTGAAILNTM